MAANKKQRARAARRARVRRINEVRIMLSMGLDKPWHNIGKHETRGAYVSSPLTPNPFSIFQNDFVEHSICLCKRCVIHMAASKLGIKL